MKVCSTCFNGRPEIKAGKINWLKIYCTIVFKRVNSNMSGCHYYKERIEKMAPKSKPAKRKIYRTSDNLALKGYWVCEVVGKPLTMQAKRPYEWGSRSGMAVRVKSDKDKEFIVEVTQSILVRQLKSKKWSDLPYDFVFAEKSSKKGHTYYELERV